MKLFTYISYFYFLLDNWDFKIAWYLIKQELAGEKKYKINTTGADELIKLEERGIDISHATIYMPASYYLLEEIFNQIPATPKNHFLDLGCGKGRSLCLAAHAGFKQVTGVDFAKELCEQATANLQITKKLVTGFNFKVVNNDAFYFDIPADVDCLFLFNPFDEIIMSAVVNNLCTSLQQNPRKINVVYVNPLHKEQFLKAGFTEVWSSAKLKYIDGVILTNQ